LGHASAMDPGAYDDDIVPAPVHGGTGGAISYDCEKTVASEGRSRCILGAPSRATPWPWLPAGAQDRFAGSETERKPRRGESQGWDEQPECMLKYMRIPSTAGTRDPERSRFFHKL
jgi:hypothetical protein